MTCTIGDDDEDTHENEHLSRLHTASSLVLDRFTRASRVLQRAVAVHLYLRMPRPSIQPYDSWHTHPTSMLKVADAGVLGVIQATIAPRTIIKRSRCVHTTIRSG